MEALSEWHDFFVAVVGAAAALAGLLFVAISINLEPLLKSPWLVNRAAITMIVLLAALLEAAVGLWPHESSLLTGSQLAIVSVLAWASVMWVWLTSEKTPSKYGSSVVTMVGLPQSALLAAIAGSVMIAVWGTEHGLFVLAFSILLAFIVSFINAWVFLVEILR